MLWQIRTLLHDSKLMLAGVADIVRFGREVDNVETSISLFFTPAHVLHRESGSEYDIVLANTTASDRFQTLLIDIYVKDNPVHPDGHYAFFDKAILLKKRGSTSIRFSYDWKHHVAFQIDGGICPPDHFWRGECRTEGKYIIRATLYGLEGETCEELTLVQKLIL